MKHLNKPTADNRNKQMALALLWSIDEEVKGKPRAIKAWEMLDAGMLILSDPDQMKFMITGSNSKKDGSTEYYVSHKACSCQDMHKSCKHKLAVRLVTDDLPDSLTSVVEYCVKLASLKGAYDISILYALDVSRISIEMAWGVRPMVNIDALANALEDAGLEVKRTKSKMSIAIAKE